MGSKRRYQISAEPIYSDHFDRLRMQSEILNVNARSITSRFALMSMNNQQDLQSLKLEWEGNDDGIFFQGEKPIPARLPAVEKKLANNADRFSRFKQQQINEGNPVPDEPPELHRERVQLEAQMDVLQEEIEEIEKRLEEAQATVQQRDDSMMLKHGPAGVGRLLDGLLWEIDGQQVRQNRKKLLIISDERSPYNGMLAADYKERIVKPWRNARTFLDKQKHKLMRELNVFDTKNPIFREAWKKRAEELYEKHPDRVWKELFSVKVKLDGRPRPAMPAYPDDVKNYLEKTETK